MICPKCKVVNDEEYSFCVECGATLHKDSSISTDAPTVMIQPDDLPPTLVNSPDNLPPTKVNSADDLAQTIFSPRETTPPTQPYSSPVSGENEPPPTVFYTPANTSENEPQATVQISPEKLPHTIQQSNQQTAQTQHYSPSESTQTEVRPEFKVANSESVEENTKRPKKSKRFLWIGTAIGLLLLIGFGITGYFLSQNLQANRNYFLTDKHDATDDKVLDFENQTSQFSMIVSQNNPSQKWQITPDPADKNYYRFTNRGVGEAESLEVVDNATDSSVMMAASAADNGQMWQITNVSGDYYRITNQWLGDTKSLSHNKRYYFFLRMKASAGNEGQLWKKIPASNGGFYLVNKQFGSSISLEAITTGDYKDKLLMKSGKSAGHEWKMTSVGNDLYSLTTDFHEKENKSLNVNKSKDDRILMSANENSDGQKWKMTPAGNDYFRLTSESLGDGKALEAVVFSKYFVEMAKTSDQDDGQLWKLRRADK